MSKYSYSKSGVSIDKGNQFVSEIKNIIKKNKKNKKSIDQNIGGFAGLYPINKNIKKPILVAATDGVGTKLDLANQLEKHDTIGIDLVAVCVNDIIVTKATPLFFLDYIATGNLKIKKGREIIKGIVKGCNESNCTLLGGETAEMPGFYSNDKYDLAGFSVGVLDGSKNKETQDLSEGDLVVGLKSSGLHSNGYSLIRKIIKDKKMSLKESIPGSTSTIGSQLLKPTKIYVLPILELFRKKIIKKCAHITGGGITENLPRILPKNMKATINLNSWKLSPLFTWIKNMGVNEKEMLKTFNCGYGMIVLIKKNRLARLKKTIEKYKLSPNVIGSLSIKKNNEKENIKFIGSL